MSAVPRTFAITLTACLFSLFAGCASLAPHAPGTALKRSGDEIIVAGELFHTGTRVITWLDPQGYDAYRVERRFSPLAESSWEKTQQATKELTTPNRYSMRASALSPEEQERMRGGGWDLPTLQRVIDQFVIHYDECGVSKVCFNVLHDHRGLSVQFMLDVDGTIYQTLDVKERARQATIANDRSIGIEIANIGAYAPKSASVLGEWYTKDANGKMVLRIPKSVGDPWIYTQHYVGYPARNEPVVGVIQGQELMQYDYTPEQYKALIHLTATLCKIFPKLTCDYPHDERGNLINHKLPDSEYKNYHGVLGHYHVQTNKIDPGPAFNWSYYINSVRSVMAQ